MIHKGLNKLKNLWIRLTKIICRDWKIKKLVKTLNLSSLVCTNQIQPLSRIKSKQNYKSSTRKQKTKPKFTKRSTIGASERKSITSSEKITSNNNSEKKPHYKSWLWTTKYLMTKSKKPFRRQRNSSMQLSKKDKKITLRSLN